MLMWKSSREFIFKNNLPNSNSCIMIAHRSMVVPLHMISLRVWVYDFYLMLLVLINIEMENHQIRASKFCLFHRRGFQIYMGKILHKIAATCMRTRAENFWQAEEIRSRTFHSNQTKIQKSQKSPITINLWKPQKSFSPLTCSKNVNCIIH